MELAQSTPHPPVVADEQAQVCACCETPRTGPYCAGCGQHYLEDDRITLRVLWSEFAQRTFHLDYGLLYTLRLLLRGPGKVARRYVLGERRRFTGPLALLAICSAFYVLTFTLYEGRYEALIDEMLDGSIEHQLTARADDPQFATFATEYVASLRTAMMDMTKRFQLYMMLLSSIPAAIGLRLFFGDQRTLAEVAVLTLYVQATLMVVSSIANPLLLLTDQLYALTIFSTLAGIGLMVWGVAHFYGRAWWQLLLGALAYLLTTGFMMALGGLMAIIISFSTLMRVLDITVIELFQRIVS